MTALYPVAWTAYLDVFLIFLRLLGLFLLGPAFSHRSIPPTVKVALALALALTLYPIVRPSLPPLTLSLEALVFQGLRETVIGFLMGFTCYLTFEAVNLAAQFVGYQVGFGSAGLIDPVNQASVSVWVPLHGWLVLMVFFFMDMHHQVLRILVMSYQVTGSQHEFLSDPGVLRALVLISGKIFVLAVQMAAPFTLVALSVNAGLGILARMLPQMNVLLFSFPLTMLLGFCTLYLVAPDLLDYLGGLMGEMSTDLINLLRTV